MRGVPPLRTRRGLLVSAAAASAASVFFANLGAAGDATPRQASKQGDSSIDALADDAIRSFNFKASEEALAVKAWICWKLWAGMTLRVA